MIGERGDPHQDGAAFPEQRWGLLQLFFNLEQCAEVVSPEASSEDRRLIRIPASKLPMPHEASKSD